MHIGAEFPAEPGRYHLYVSLGCPWANRTVTLRSLKGLEQVVGRSVVNPPINFDHVIRGYNRHLPQLNPAGIMPIGPELDFNEPHGRESRGG